MLDALDAIHRFQAAFAELEFDAAYALIAEALESDPITTWHRIVQHHSSDFFRLVEFLDRRREMADLLEGVYARAPDMIDVPPSSTDPDLPAKLKRQRLDNIEKGLPYFLMASQGKSGSISFGNIVPAGFSLTCTTYSMIHLAVIPSWARDYARGGASYNTHLLPTKTNIDALRQAGLTRIVVHTRDPRQIYLSVLHHQDRYRSAYPEKQASGSFSLSLPEQALAETFLDGTRDKLLALADGVAGGELRLDFGRITCLGSTALGLLVTLHRRTDRAGGHLVLANLPPHLCDLFRLTRLDTILDVRAA